MATLIFDIETVGEKWEDLDQTSQEVLTRWIDKTAKDDDDREAQIEDLKDGLGFSPLTGFVVAIGLYDLERKKGVVFYDNKGEGGEESTHEGYTLKPRTEKEMLQDFWDGARQYDTFVTFNGRGFDVPFLALRSGREIPLPTTKCKAY
jgi:3'-5' exonuclease